MAVMPPDDPPTESIRALQVATAALIADAHLLDEEALRAPSLLPNWSRAHVLAHLAQNAAGGTRLLDGVLSGTPGWEYRNLEVRARDIEDGSHAPFGVLVDDLETTAHAFGQVCAGLSAADWSVPVTWTTGHRSPACHVVISRLFEVQIHHIDLDLGYSVADWSGDFTALVLDAVVEAYVTHADFPPLTIQLDGHEQRRIGAGPLVTTVTGSRAEVLAWLLGRTAGRELGVHGSDHLPALPDLY